MNAFWRSTTVGSKLWRWAAALGVLSALAAAIVYSIVGSRLAKQYSFELATAPVPEGPEALRLGEHLTRTVGICEHCHGADLGGDVQFKAPLAGNLAGYLVGYLASPNLTKGRGSAVASFSDADWFRAIRHGVSRQGRSLLLMPAENYSSLSLQEIAYMIAYLKTIAPVDRELGQSSLGLVMRGMYLVGLMPQAIAAERVDHHAAPRPYSEPEPTAAYGSRLARTCSGCHGEHYAGGTMPGALPGARKPSNLTPHQTGIADWQLSDLQRALVDHKAKDGRELADVMPRAYAQLRPVEIEAIYRFLRTLPPREFGLH
ncbi:MAG TPA: c-type cytochrome [Polyangiales bacterium]|nr:c-type cytochrome [Polyangiales bacterium]